MNGLNDIYGAALTLPPSPLAEVGDLPEASAQAESTPNPVDQLPSASGFATPPSNGLAAFPVALKQENLPAYIIAPPSPSVSVRTASTGLTLKIKTFTGTPYRVRNHRTGAVTAWTGSADTLTVPLLPNDWNLLTLEMEAGEMVLNFDINHTDPRISGNFVLHLGGFWPRFGTLAGAGWLNVRLIDLQVPASIAQISYWSLARTDMRATQIDRLLIAADAGGWATGTLIYSLNPGSDDALRSTAGLAALNSLLSKGWTITR